MRREYNLQDARKRVKRVFQYLRDLNHIKTPPVVNYDRYEWKFWLDTLPLFPSIVRGKDFTNLQLLGVQNDYNYHGADGDFIIKISRPNETECPEPSVMLKNWLKAGYASVGADPSTFLRKELEVKGGSKEKFEDVQGRVKAFEDWTNLKRQWETSEKKALDALGAFEDLFDLYGKIQRESERYQIYAADGILVTEKDGHSVRHPIFLQRIALDFDPSVPAFVLRDTSDPPEIYSALLRFLAVDGSTLKQVRELLQSGHHHPFGGEDTSNFFKDIAQRLWSDGQYFNNEIEARGASGTYLYRRPHIYLGLRTFGFAESIDKYIDIIPKLDDFPESLLRVVGIDTGRGAERDESETESIDLLLTKSSNAEQERVLHRLEETGAVLVQGPPGTGKSHTIANLIGHLLAQGKSILVTSHTSKALRVVRDHVAKKLQPLCVAVLESDEDNNKQLEESVSGIINYLAATSTNKLDKQIETLKEKRDTLKKEYDDTREQLLQAAEEEYRALDPEVQKTLPSEAARWILESGNQNSWIPGPIANQSESPLSAEEVQSLYEINARITKDDEVLLDSVLPDPEMLPDPESFANHFDQIKARKNSQLSVGTEFWTKDDQSEDILKDLAHKAEAAAEVFDADQEWVNEFLEIGRMPEEQQKPWFELMDLVDRCCKEIPEKEALVLTHGPQINSFRSDAENLKICQAIVKRLEAGKTIKGLLSFLHRDWTEFVENAKVDSGKPSKAVHFKALANLLEVRALRENLHQRWNRQVELLKHNPVPGGDLGKQPEHTLQAITKKMREAINWYKNQWGEFQQELVDSGFDWERFLKKALSQKQEGGALRTAIENLLIPVLEARMEFIRWHDLENQQDRWVEYLDSFDRKEASYELIKQFRAGLRRPDFDAYRQSWEKLLRLNDLKEDHVRRKELLEKLREPAPAWVDALASRKSPHNSGKYPGDPNEAWKHRHWEQLLEERAKVDLDDLQSQLNEIKDETQEVTAEYVEKLAWLAQLKRTGLEQQQALNGWLGLHKKIGKGTGKHVREYKEEAKNTLIKCREAVPVWIMPLSRVVESFDIATSQFDVVIIDEASQCDVLGLVAFALAREVVVVGDHEQVSPYAVGFGTDQMHELIDEILVDIPNKKLYDAKSSVYDLARQSFGGTIRLLEHFRCVPDIIQFSNQLCYNQEIQPLREASASPVSPALVPRYVENGEDDDKVNQAEALEIVSLILALTRFKQYDNSTIGVISLVGTEQAVYIDSLLRRRMTVSEYQKRRVLCGNAAQFQGDERDIILLSMVNSPSKSGRALHLRASDEAQKVFNVAASRARDQFWIVYSLDPGKDLKTNDLRLKLIQHATNPDGLRSKKIEKSERKLNSELEKQVYEDLTKAKYSTMIGCQVGEFVLDLVVIGEKGNRVAIQCDGDREISREELVAALHRQMTLERLGWNFIRVRGSEYLRHPGEALKKIQQRLKKFDIQPLGFFSTDPKKREAQKEAQSKELLAQVIERAKMIQAHWKDVPSVSAVNKSSSETDAKESKQAKEAKEEEEVA
ncbi:MAG: AAA family ATPase [Deltaproteobacteria bacterium]|nr:AAA family ATPase [Deltaproteobacteria bacterium]